MTKRNLKEESLFNMQLLVHHQRKPGQELGAVAMEERRLLAWFFRLAQLPLLYNPVLPLPPRQLTIKKMPA